MSFAAIAHPNLASRWPNNPSPVTITATSADVTTFSKPDKRMLPFPRPNSSNTGVAYSAALTTIPPLEEVSATPLAAAHESAVPTLDQVMWYDERHTCRLQNAIA